ncbi:ABC transporter substrate-binding protein [Photobacterium sp. OFAV2-7]|uniref:substrate-binding periplasmic protein n=1 Tax=Photobacterium sp. OFAV2-7 TaxID=2917748 RepID=UPI001EF42FFA|nr:transporter substrate-binding domain-containing protein [Photobacterium sp. OFAV2-7]MCG7586986.1 transporter substrate-binding domain-containing protein [Photobacterium sp. OFAV2-7]
MSKPNPTHRLFILLLPALLLCQSAFAVTTAKPIIEVGSYHCPPFVIKHDDGTYSGLSILLWERIAEQLGLQYEIRELGLKELLEAVSTRKINIGISCLSITPERELILDFSHSFYETHLAIAVKKQDYLASVKNIITNKHLLTVLGFVLAAAAVVGAIFYLLEHRVNEKLYSTSSRCAQLIEGFILGLLFITKGPFNYFEFKTLTGRVITVILAIATTLFIASITAVLASTFTLGLLSSDIKGPNDLANIPVGAKEASTSSEFLTNHSIVHRTYTDNSQLLEALEANEVQAIVADDAVLKYLIKKSKEKGEYRDLIVLPYQFEKQNYGFAIEDKSQYAETLNRALLRVRKTPEWRQALHEYFAER